MRHTGLLSVLVAACLACAGAASAAVVIVDNPGAVFTGTWPTSTHATGQYYGANYQHSNKIPGLTATYTPTLPMAGQWLVEALWNCSTANPDPGRGNDVPYTINYNGGSTMVNRHQGYGGGEWQGLGTYSFDAGTGGNVEVSSTVSNSQYVIADAMRFSLVSTGGGSINAIADSYIQDNTATTNYGASGQLRVKLSENDSNNRKTYVRFNMSGAGFDRTTELASASLNLNFIDSAAGAMPDANSTWDFEVFGLNDGHAGEAWNEGTINWTNAPANDTGVRNGLLSGEVTSLGTFPVTGKGVGLVQFSTPALETFIRDSADDVATFIILRTTAGTSQVNYVHAIASSEHGTVDGPQLVLTEVPEPATLTLLAMGAAGLLTRKRRRA